MVDILPQTPLSAVVGSSAARLEKNLGLRTVGDLLNHFPRRYIEASALSTFAELDEGDHVTFIAEVVSSSRRTLQTRRGFIAEVTVEDDAGERLRMAYFNGYQAARELQAGVRALFHGKVTTYKGQLTLNNPVYEVTASDPESAPTDVTIPSGPMPLYPATAGITSWDIKRCVDMVISMTELSAWPDPLPQKVLTGQSLMTRGEAFRAIHQPLDAADHAAGWHRMRWEEAILVQGALSKRRAQAAQGDPVVAARRDFGVLAHFDAQLPFQLTTGQQDSGAVIAADLESGAVMNRLLQGEVGSGKTLVALRAMLQMIDAGAQAAFVAPTELLAIQHFRSLQATLGDLVDQGLLTSSTGAPGDQHRVRIVLLTGSMKTAERRRALLDITSGNAHIVVGTHALFSEQVQFFRLGLLVVDEQHRFGVEQRHALRERSTPTPHMLVMSATPIPRSVAMTVFADLDLTVLTGLPGGRSPIQTHVVPLMRGPQWIRRVWQIAAEETTAGHQVYVVCPRIVATERSEAENERQLQMRFGDSLGQGVSREAAMAHVSQDASVELITDRLSRDDVLQGVRIEPLHGQMRSEEAAEVMARFDAGETQVLIATTVVEVGVDVPNATTMIILDADAFGTSTLHQLRGRIGRGHTDTNRCLLVTRLPEDHPSMGRLHEIAEHSDGMTLARLDLQRRQEGDVLGAEQSGRGSSLRCLRIIQDEDIIVRASQYFSQLEAADPHWSTVPELAAAVAAWEYEQGEAAQYASQG